ncbi:MAG: DNA-binding protein WhiA [Clostridia bacterium]|nr:DNA-binding protein WhiA [Clostridia bacterium]
MSFTSEIKKQITDVKIIDKKAQSAFISAFLRTCGSVETSSDDIGFSAYSEEDSLKYFARLIKLRYGKTCVIEKVAKTERARATLIDGDSLYILTDLGILKKDGGGIEVSLNIGADVCPDEVSAKAFIAGAFLGAGSITVPKLFEGRAQTKTGYHLEVVFSKYVTAADFSSLLAENGFFPKLVERKEQFVVYFKNVEEIESFIGMCGANGAYFKLNDLQIQKEIRNRENRKINCEMSNMTKTIDASIRSREDIKTVIDCVGAEGLSEPLRLVADARLNNEDMSLQELADMLGISKSCLTHRLRKLSELAKTLR